MNIQMILSALPTPLSGKPEPGAGDGQFALALNQAAQNTPGQAGSTTFPAAFSATSVEGLPPPTMAAQQALLQALNAHAGQQLDGEAGPALPDAGLSEIMARLALIEGSHQEPAMADLPPLPGQQPAPPADEMAVELSELPQAAALVATAAAETQRPSAAISGLRAGGESAARPDMPAVPNQAVPGNPLTAQLAASATAATQQASDDATATARPMDFTTALAKVSTPQTGGELRGTSTDAPRGSFVPESAPMAPSSASTTAPANAPAQPPLAQASLAAPLQSPAWPGQLGQQLVQFARQGGEQQVEMRLNPAELGPLSVTLKMTEQGAQAQFLSAHAQVRQVLEQAIPQLREALAEQGISLGETSVGEQRRQDAQEFAGNDGQRRQGAQALAEDELAQAGDDMGVVSSSTLSLDGRVNLYA
ncbi:flagellar hook-length control protein FliK [Halomonas sp. LR3S48]|uniref:flagellar hook-length control protein FliK n=1 Tax=Halomonas sp. LR3S48 TaxID=2982694 RepID=UPI0021E46265|nr:flagellar hook-length control protein FliK [Halomonas sp. LR3S48]UYG02094.1 flagellar hook-length control protein FliK [Halomonas sp. LR3S48]